MSDTLKIANVIDYQIICFKTFPNVEVPFLVYLKTPKMPVVGTYRVFFFTGPP